MSSRQRQDMALIAGLVDSIPNPILVVDENDGVVLANLTAENFFHTSARMLKASGLKSVIPQTSPVYELLDEVRQSRNSIYEYEVVIGKPRTGGERLVDLQIAPLIDSPGFALIQVQQRSVASKIDRQLTHRNAARSVTGMAEMLAHEIKNPLSGIRGAAQLLEGGLEGADIELTRLIVSETDRIRDLVNQMEAFSDARPIQKTAVNIHSVLNHVKQVALAGFARGIKINEVYDPSLPPVLGNRDQLVQVFMNLVKNAAEAIAEEKGQGDITLSTAFKPGVRLGVQGSKAMISLPFEVCVKNTGARISKDIQPHLFEPFVSSKPNGKGLGLALTAKIVGDHGGIIESVFDGKATVFRILLPLSREEAADA